MGIMAQRLRWKRKKGDERELADRHFVYTVEEWCRVAGIRRWTCVTWRQKIYKKRMPRMGTTKTAIYAFLLWKKQREFRWPRGQSYAMWTDREGGMRWSAVCRKYGVGLGHAWTKVRQVEKTMAEAKR